MSDTGKVVVVTGASRGLGRELAVGLAGVHGAVAVHFASDEAAARQTAVRVRERGAETLTVRADLSDPQAAQEMVGRVVDTWGGIHLLINNAAIIDDHPLVSMSEEAWDRVLAVNLSGPFFTMRAAAPIMERQGGGEIINVVSLAGLRGNPGQANYAAAKAGLIGLTRAAACEWGPGNIRVNAVSPGFMETDMTERAPDRIKARALEQSCLGRYCDPEEVVLLVKTLIRMRGVTGQVFHVDNRII